MICLGDKVRDSISGYVGVVVARTEWLHGCIRVGVAKETTDKDGKIQDEVWLDESRVVLVATGKAASRRPGGPRADAQRSKDPSR